MEKPSRFSRIPRPWEEGRGGEGRREGRGGGRGGEDKDCPRSISLSYYLRNGTDRSLLRAQWNLITQTLRGQKEELELLKVPQNTLYTSVQGPRTPVKLVKDPTKGIVDLKRVHCIAFKKPKPSLGTKDQCTHIDLSRSVTDHNKWSIHQPYHLEGGREGETNTALRHGSKCALKPPVMLRELYTED